MDAFILSASLGFVVYECLAYAGLPGPRAKLRIGDMTISFKDASTYLWVWRIVRAGIVFALLLCILFIHQIVLPADAIAQNKINITLGFFFGPILGIWINSIIRHNPGEALTTGQIVGGIGLIVFFVVGSVGNQAGNLVQKIASHISLLKVGGAELAFSDKASKERTPGVGASLPAGQGSAANSSTGLVYLGNLKAFFIEKDRAYLNQFYAMNPALDGKLAGIEIFAEKVALPPFACLAGWLGATADRVSVDSHLRAFGQLFRQISALDSAERRKKLTGEFIRLEVAVASDVLEYSAGPPQVEAGCKELLLELCPKVEKRPERQNCVRGLVDEFGNSPVPRPGTQLDKSAIAYAEDLEAFSQADTITQYPYFAIGYASLMAQLGQYEAAGAVLFDWLETKKLSNAPRTLADDWFEIRARSIIAAYFEEWVRRDGDNIGTAVRDEHLQNLQFMRTSLKQRLLTNRFFAVLLVNKDENKPLVLIRPGSCGLGEPASLWRDLFRSFISMDSAYLQNTLLHPRYNKSFAETTTNDLKWLAQLDMSCIPQKDGSDVIYAQALEAYTHNALKYSDVTKGTESDAARKTRLEEAVRAAKLGLEIVDSAVNTEKAERQRQGAQFIARIALSDAVAVQEALEQNLKSLTDSLTAD